MSDVATRLERALGEDVVRAHSAIDGPFAELPLVAPADEDGVLEVLRLAAADALRVLPVGFGSKLSWCPRPSGSDAADLLLSTRRLAGVVAFEPGDGTLTARAGSSLAELAHTVEDGGLSVTPAVPTPTTATLGGVLAAGQNGIDRARYGPARHHVLGMRVALADGTLARTGGRLVKNVTGFDLQRLYCGSHGTLCVILEATLRLFPAPQAMTALRSHPKDLATALEQARALRALPIQPWTMLVDHDANGTELHVVLAGREEVVAWETERALSVLPEANGTEVQHGRAARAQADVLCDREREQGTWPHVHASCRPSHLTGVVERWAPRCTRLRIQPGVATLDVWLADPPDTPARVVQTEPLPEVATRMMHALRARLDPNGLFAPHLNGTVTRASGLQEVRATPLAPFGNT